MSNTKDEQPPVDAGRVDPLVRRSLVLRLRDLSHTCDPYTGYTIEELADEIDTLLRGTIKRAEQNGGYVGMDGQWIKELRKAIAGS